MTACATTDSSESAASESDTGVGGSEESIGSIRNVIDEVVLLTGDTGLGEKPLLSWSAVAGAVEYSVVIRDAEGQVYWSWRGVETEVPFGGGADDGQYGQNAYLHGTMSWTVVAFDDSLFPLAISREASLTP